MVELFRFIETLGKQIFRIDDASDEAPMIQLQFFNEFNEIPYAIRTKVAKRGLDLILKDLLEELNKE